MCGIFGIRAPERDNARLAYFGLHALQHRGQESAGIAVCDEGRLYGLRDMGLVTQVFNEQSLRGLQGQLAIGHCRYSTTGGSHWENSQPLILRGRARTVALAHNGNLTNVEELRAELARQRVRLSTSSDSEIVAALIANDERPLEEAIASAMSRLVGAYSIVALADSKLVAFRDPHGIRPLCFGRLDDDWVVASESCALDLVGAKLEREIEPGELVVIDDDGCRQIQAVEPAEHSALCIFELFYLARPDSRLLDVEVHGARVRMGEILAAESPVEADLVMPIPDSGTPAAIGFSRGSGIPLQRRADQEPLRRPHLHRARAEAARTGRQAEVQPARRGGRQARGGRRRLDRARLDHAQDRLDAVRGRRNRGARAHLLAAGRLPLLLRDRLWRRR